MTDIAALSSGHLLARGIDHSVASTMGVKVEYDTTTGSELAYYFPLYLPGLKFVGWQKKLVRAPGQRQKKDVCRIGDGTNQCLPFGAHKMGEKGKFLVVVEGAEDQLAAVQMFKAKGKNYKVVASLGTDSWKRQLEYYESFEKVAIAYDQDEGGIKAREQFAAALSPGKAFIMSWNPEAGPDPNALLIGRAGDVWYDSCMSAKGYEASGIIFGDEVWKRMSNYTAPTTITFPPEFAVLNQKMEGMRLGEVSIWTAGSSIGKTSFIRRIKQHVLASTPYKIAEAELEESVEKTARGLYQFYAGSRWKGLTDEERLRVHNQTYGTNRIFILENGLDSKKRGSLLGRFKQMHYDKGCTLFALDHVTLGVREFGDGASLSAQDEMMESFVNFAETCKIHMLLISHLRKAPSAGGAWSMGAVPTEEDMKGSGSLYQLSADVVTVARNKMSADPYERNVSHLGVSKCRETGDTGPADDLWWNHPASCFEPADQEPEPNTDDGAPL